MKTLRAVDLRWIYRTGFSLLTVVIAATVLAGDEKITLEEPAPRSGSLRKSLARMDWVVELETVEVSPNRGRAKITASHDGKLTIHRSTTGTLPEQPEQISDLPETQRIALLDIAVQAREAVDFSLPLQKVGDSPNVFLRLESGRRQIELKLSGSFGETNRDLISKLQQAADRSAPEALQILDAGYLRYYENYRKQHGNVRAVTGTVWGNWELEVRAGNGVQQSKRLRLRADRTLDIINADAEAANRGTEPAPLYSTHFNRDECDKLIELALKTFDEFTFSRDAPRREGGTLISLRLSSGNLWCDRSLKVVETGVSREDLAESFVLPIVEFINAKLPESKRVLLK